MLRWSDWHYIATLAAVLAGLAAAGCRDAMLLDAPLTATAEHPTGRPAAGLMLPCEVVEVYDGDTVTVRLTVDARVRLVDCWAPEIRTTDAAEKIRGVASRDHLKEMALGRRGYVWVGLESVDRVDGVLSMGRVLGTVYVGDDQRSLAERQVAAGHATASKDATE